jgi:cytochrome c oxidase assembly factor CtaG
VSYLLDHWSAGPCLLAVLALAAWHEAGLALLARRSGPARARQRRLRSFWFYGGLAVLVIAVESPIGYWSRDYFYVHMIQHLLLMFAAPSLIVAGAPWQPLLAVLPRAGRAAAGPGPAPQSPGTGRPGPVRALAGAVARPWLAIALFNAVMVAWHFPVLLDAAERSEPVRWLMYGCFLLAGVLFWAQFISSPPLRMRMTPAAQAAALLITNVVMWILAMAMVLGLQPHPRHHAAADGGPADRRRDSLGLRRLLGGPLHDHRDTPADQRGWRDRPGHREDHRPRFPALPVGQPLLSLPPGAVRRRRRPGPR